QALLQALTELRDRGHSQEVADRALGLLRRRSREHALDPRYRLGQLWREEQPLVLTAPELSTWRGWLAQALAPAALIIVAPPLE
ncbi:MAG: hypothetical protein JRI23_05695, partial [Deltaproteobacteria bacterium]|nr:hypothetical protein [Deltaproteobacteria bacterium]MBW2531055.1 hypothetical protein [Deltaproteobacteria bacterium]